MKKFIFYLVIILGISATQVSANPFLVCDCQDDVVEYEIILDGNPSILVPAEVKDCTGSQKRLWYDVGNVGNGIHTVEVRAKNVWGASNYVPFSFTKTVPGDPSGMGLKIE